MALYPRKNPTFDVSSIVLVTAEYPATPSALEKRAGYAVRGDNKFKVVVYLI